MFNKCKISFLLPLICFFTLPSFADGQLELNPLSTNAGKVEAKCYNNSLYQNNADQGVCIHKALAIWDQDLNKYYNLLMRILPKKQRVQLQTSQMQWIKYKNAEITSNKSIEDAYRLGSGFRVLDLEITKHRTLQLKYWYDYLSALNK